jgi:hypothetical protein
VEHEHNIVPTATGLSFLSYLESLQKLAVVRFLQYSVRFEILTAVTMKVTLLGCDVMQFDRLLPTFGRSVAVSLKMKS